MAATDKAINISSYFSEISALGKAGEYEKALRICNKILQESGEDTDASHCKVVCLIQLEKFDDALKQIHKNPTLASGILFEKAYCEYRLNQITESRRTLQLIPDPDTRCKELLAQVLYRQEEFEDCLELYKDVIKNSEDNYEDERQTNLAAVLAAVNKVDQEINKPEEIGIKEETYETVYNLACYYISIGDITTAIEKLDHAEKLCREMLQEDADEDGEVSAEDLDVELALIRVQKGFALQLLGKNDAAIKLYNMVAKQRPSEPGLAAVTANNIVTINKEQNVFDSKKKMRVATADNVKHKLNSSQKQNIAINNCLLLLYMNQYEECRRNLRLLVSQYPSCQKIATLIEAAIFVREKQMAKAVALLDEFMSGSDECDMSMVLSLTQLHLQQGRVSQACSTLEGLPTTQIAGCLYQSGIVSTLVSLYTHLEDGEIAERLLNNAVKWHWEHLDDNPQTLVLMKQCAKYMMRNANYKEAAEIFQSIMTMDGSDSTNHTLAQLISAYSHFDMAKAQALADNLPSAQQMAASIDVDTLENTGITLPGRFSKKDKRTDSPTVKSGASTSSHLDTAEKKKKKTHRKKILPKNYDPYVDPDQERWLPRWERSTYHGRKKRDKRRGVVSDVGRGTQGASLQAMAELDASNSPKGTQANTPGSPQGAGASMPGPRQQKPAAAAAAASSKQKKKKKGGNKW